MAFQPLLKPSPIERLSEKQKQGIKAKAKLAGKSITGQPGISLVSGGRPGQTAHRTWGELLRKGRWTRLVSSTWEASLWFPAQAWALSEPLDNSALQDVEGCLFCVPAPWAETIFHNTAIEKLTVLKTILSSTLFLLHSHVQAMVWNGLFHLLCFRVWHTIASQLWCQQKCL